LKRKFPGCRAGVEEERFDAGLLTIERQADATVRAGRERNLLVAPLAGESEANGGLERLVGAAGHERRLIDDVDGNVLVREQEKDSRPLLDADWQEIVQEQAFRGKNLVISEQQAFVPPERGIDVSIQAGDLWAREPAAASMTLRTSASVSPSEPPAVASRLETSVARSPAGAGSPSVSKNGSSAGV